MAMKEFSPKLILQMEGYVQKLRNIQSAKYKRYMVVPLVYM